MNDMKNEFKIIDNNIRKIPYWSIEDDLDLVVGAWETIHRDNRLRLHEKFCVEPSMSTIIILSDGTKCKVCCAQPQNDKSLVTCLTCGTWFHALCIGTSKKK